MRDKGFQFKEDPDHPEHLLYTREFYEIDLWIRRRERNRWLCLFAFQIIFGSLIWAVLFR